MRIAILTISDLGAVGQRADTSGDAILDWASEHGYEVVVRSVVSDETDRIAGKLVRWSDSGEVDVVLTTGGTGLTERDVTPEATAAILEREAEGIAEALRAADLARVGTLLSENWKHQQALDPGMQTTEMGQLEAAATTAGALGGKAAGAGAGGCMFFVMRGDAGVFRLRSWRSAPPSAG